MKTSDIPEIPILEFVKDLTDRGEWATTFMEFNTSVANAMPEGVNRKLILSKMKAMIGKGLLSGCACGCRGEIEITEKGRDFLKSVTTEPQP